MLEKVNAKKPSKVKPNQHPLKEILDGALGFSEMQLRQELWRHGHNIFPSRLYFMLRGQEDMPPDVEASLRLVAAEHLEERPLTQEEADRVIEGWFRGDENEPSPDL